ncbi:endolytic transglycosylase MltG [bacterium SCSIO 12696]|nr:endolytic transglycosylase MltG [bacterium SCSIO 12696]
MLRRLLVGALIATVLLAIGGYVWLTHLVKQPLSLEEPLEFSVESGSNLTRLLGQLHDQHDLFSSHIQQQSLLLYARFNDLGDIQAGDYRLQPGVTPISLLDKLNSGDVVYHQVTLPEGLTVKQWLAKLRDQPHLQASDSDQELLAAVKEANPEGWLFPDSYRYHRGDNAADIVQRAHRTMQQTLTELWQNRAPDLPYQNPYEALVMASIIEKETGVAHERPAIAGVFVRRLQRGMRLQTDPTVIYGLGDSYKGNLTRTHLRQRTAYNTYVIKGLPPTPIANPGAEAIYAALHPADGNALYFVAKGDGSHYFSATLKEHQRAVDQYQRRQRRSDYRSAPPVNK